MAAALQRAARRNPKDRAALLKAAQAQQLAASVAAKGVLPPQVAAAQAAPSAGQPLPPESPSEET